MAILRGMGEPTIAEMIRAIQGIQDSLDDLEERVTRLEGRKIGPPKPYDRPLP